MKNKVIIFLTIILGLLAAVGPRTIFAVCPAGEMKMRCYDTAQWELVVGGVYVLAGIGLFLTKSDKLRIALIALQTFLGLVVLLIPTVLVGVCSSPMMHCASVTRPALFVIGVLQIVTGLVSLYFETSKSLAGRKLKVS